jgi:hypothetical protein
MQSVIPGSENHENETLLPFITICPETAFCHSWSLVCTFSQDQILYMVHIHTDTSLSTICSHITHRRTGLEI